MSYRRILGPLLLLSLCCSAAAAQEPAASQQPAPTQEPAPYAVPAEPYASQPVGGNGSYALAPRAGIPTSWNASDESWYETNRAIALAGKIMTVVGVGLIIGGAAAESDALLYSGVGVQSVGQIGWSIADLRCANRMSRRGVEVRNASGIAAVIGAFIFSPITWISGPVQSMRIRDAHNSLMLTSAQPPRMQALGSTLRLNF
jgi:hypothetical protein